MSLSTIFISDAQHDPQCDLDFLERELLALGQLPRFGHPGGATGWTTEQWSRYRAIVRALTARLTGSFHETPDQLLGA